MPEKKHKRYSFSVTEEMVMNPKYFGFRGGRIEIFDRKSQSPYSIYEARFFVPEEFFEAFREVFDGKETNKSPKKTYLRWDMKGDYRKK
ncbi:hypothetical protein COS75_00450 [Candidatus Pacearchaeota archaeon CG06_land_8_20_14_3_00_35_12]|nr:MAG: hypothetical protein COS75_00450 [Candidatus Pacearchaeota archaeon CG06_land_8_20_14_3_00_35_12]